MKIIFMGTPEFAVPSLSMLIDRDYSIETVITAPDKPRGRGQVVAQSPVKEFAVARSLPVLQPENLKDPDFLQAIRAIGADLFVVVAFRILPRELYTIPPKGAFNLHASLLPKYRGAAPINRAIMSGEKQTGVTTFFLEDRVDTGRIIMQDAISIGDNETAGEVHDRLMSLGADVVFRTVRSIEHGTIELREQDESLATPAPKIFKEDCLIDWQKSAVEVHNLIRSVSPLPGAFTHHQGKIVKIYRSAMIASSAAGRPGAIEMTENSMLVHTGNGAVEIRELQIEGKKRMRSDQFLRGHSFADQLSFDDGTP